MWPALPVEPATARPPSTRPPPTPVETTMPSTLSVPARGTLPVLADGDRDGVADHPDRHPVTARTACPATETTARPGCSPARRCRASRSSGAAVPTPIAGARRRVAEGPARRSASARVDGRGQRRRTARPGRCCAAWRTRSAATTSPRSSTTAAANLVPPMSTARARRDAVDVGRHPAPISRARPADRPAGRRCPRCRRTAGSGRRAPAAASRRRWRGSSGRGARSATPPRPATRRG